MIRVTVDGSLTAMISGDRLTVLNGILLPGSVASRPVDLHQPDGSVIAYNPDAPTAESVEALLNYLHPEKTVEVFLPEPTPITAVHSDEVPELPLMMPRLV